MNKKKRGRKALPPDERRSELIQFRVPRKLLREVDAMAAKANPPMTRSEMLRQLLLG